MPKTALTVKEGGEFMYDSGVSVSSLVASVKAETDVSLRIPNDTFVTWVNEVQQLLYTEIIKEQARDEKVFEVKAYTQKIPLIGYFFQDIHKVYANRREIEFTLTTLNASRIFENVYCCNDGNLEIYSDDVIRNVEIIYFRRPPLITVTSSDVIGAGNVMVPYEFLELIKAKLRGEAYKFINALDKSAVWLNDYNNLIENFKVWVTSRNPGFGE